MENPNRRIRGKVRVLGKTSYAIYRHVIDDPFIQIQPSYPVDILHGDKFDILKSDILKP